jgi:hypothetical protein
MIAGQARSGVFRRLRVWWPRSNPATRLLLNRAVLSDRIAPLPRTRRLVGAPHVLDAADRRRSRTHAILGSRSKSASSFPAAPDRLELALRANWPATWGPERSTVPDIADTRLEHRNVAEARARSWAAETSKRPSANCGLSAGSGPRGGCDEGVSRDGGRRTADVAASRYPRSVFGGGGQRALPLLGTGIAGGTLVGRQPHDDHDDHRGFVLVSDDGKGSVAGVAALGRAIDAGCFRGANIGDETAQHGDSSRCG